jgi:hypothetical protein
MVQRKVCLQYYLEYCYYMWRRRLIAGILVCMGMYLHRIKSRKRRTITYGPMIDRDVDRLTRLNRSYNGTEAHCISELRMRKVVFHKLCGELRSRALLEDTFHVAIEEQVAMFIHCVGHHWSNRSIGFEFMRSSETVNSYFHHVLDVLCILARDLICIRSVETHSKITSAPSRFHPYFEVHRNWKSVFRVYFRCHGNLFFLKKNIFVGMHRSLGWYTYISMCAFPYARSV